MSSNNDAPISIEKLYQKKTQLEHVLLRPDSYVGSIKREESVLWVYDGAKKQMTERKITYNPALYKIFDEILVNASDNKIRDPKMSSIKIDIKQEENMIRIWNNGKGIPVVKNKDHNVYVPTMVFGHLLTSTNFDDTKKQVTGGRNGYGAKLCNIFSTKFTVETSSKEYRKGFKQTWENNMSTCGDPIIADSDKEDFTCVTFYPDLKRFGMTHLDDDTVALFNRRAYDMAACTNGIKVHLNGQQVLVNNFKDYVDLYTKGCTNSNGDELKVIYEKYDDRWEVAITTSTNDTFTQVSFVNSIATTKGGTHVNYLADQAANRLLEIAKKKIKNDKQTVKLKPAQVKMNMWIFVKCLVENPSFDSQTKTNMTLNAKDFGSTCTLSDKFINQLSKCGIVERVMTWANFKDQEMLNKKCSKTKQSKLKDIAKLNDANCAGTKKSLECRLFLTEGDSAKTLAVSGFSVVGNDLFGVFPLKGKMLNVRDASSKQLADNDEISKLINILGLRYDLKYEEIDSLKTLRYGKLVLMTDQDQDGSHIKGLVINFIHSKWPNLMKHNFIEQFITPIVKVTLKKEKHSFYSIPEFRKWEKDTENSNKWTAKYYKGLGTSTSLEAKEYFSDMKRHLITFRYSSDDGKSIIMAFSKDKADERKAWLTAHMQKKKENITLGLDEECLYEKNTTSITFDDFIHKELVLFSNTDNERSIPCLIDGFKPGQRKVLFACLKRNLTKELKVAQLAGSVAELSAYHHGEASLMGTIINLAQDFVGSNNINLLMPEGQFGTRLIGGKDSASPRYIFTYLNPLTKLIFHPDDETILKTLFDDNLPIEPEWYAPIIPMVLVNGCDGIGTGWSTKIPNFNPKDIIANVRRMINKQPIVKMHPWYKNFRGTIQELGENKYQVSGEISTLGENCVEITELPIKVWTSSYKENVMEVYRNQTDKCPAMISDYKEYNTDTTVRFVVEMSSAKMQEAQTMGLHKFFKLQSQLTMNNMILFDECGVIKKYENAEQILEHFYPVRLQMYEKRKKNLLWKLTAEAANLENQARFILEKIAGTIRVENVKIKAFIELLIKGNYDSDQVKIWKNSFKSNATEEDGNNNNEDEEGDGDKPDFTYLTHMHIMDLTEDKKNALLAKRDAKIIERDVIKNKSLEQFWLEDLDNLEKAMQELKNTEIKQMNDNAGDNEEKSKGIKKPAKKGGKNVKVAAETAPSKFSIKVEPRLDEDFLKKFEVDKKKKDIKKQAQMMQDFLGPKEKRDSQPMKVVANTDDIDNDDPLPLAERLMAKKNAVPKGKKISKNDVLKTSPTQKRKRETWESDSDSEEINIVDKQKIASNISLESSLTDTSANFKELIKPVQSTLSGFIKKDDSDKAKKPKTAIPKENKPPAVKKLKVEKVPKTKAQPKAAEPKPKAAKPKVVKKPTVSKKIDVFSDDDSETEIAKPAIKPRRQLSKKTYVDSDESGDNYKEDSDSDFEFAAKSKRKKISDSE